MSEEQEATEQQAEQPNLSIGDLQVIKNIIDVVVSRGAIRSEEMTTVGATYDRLKSFLDVVAPKPAEVEPEDGEAAEQTEATNEA